MIELANVSKHAGEKCILHDINVSFRRGELTFVVGTSGAGKTTLLNIIGGLDCPDSGDVVYDGKSVLDDLSGFRAKAVGVCFQDNNLIAGLTAGENVMLAANLSGRDVPEQDAEAELRKLGIADSRQESETLSGGEKQRVSLLRSVLKGADVIIADEPTGSLDSENAAKVFAMLKELSQNRHVIVVSHDKEMSGRYADRMVTMKDGCVVDDSRRQASAPEKKAEEQDRKDNKRSLLRHVVFTLGKNSVRVRKGRFVMLIAAIALSITAIALAVTLRRNGGEVSEQLSLNYLESDMLKLHYGFDPNAGYAEKPFSEESITEITDTGEVEEIVKKYYPAGPENSFFITSAASISAYVKQINMDEFFRKRIMSLEIEGRFPEKDEEIILAEDVAEQLFGKNATGKEILLTIGQGIKRRCVIVGVNHTTNAKDRIYSFVSAELIRGMKEEELHLQVNGQQFLYEYSQKVYGKDDLPERSDPIKVFGSCAEDGSEILVYGERPAASDQALISTMSFLHLMEIIGFDSDYSPEDVMQGRMSKKDVETVLSHRFVRSFNGVFPITFSGVYLSDELEVRYRSERIEEMLIVEPEELEVYLKNKKKTQLLKEQWNNQYPFKAFAEQEALKNEVAKQTDFLEIAIICLGVILLMVSLAMVISYAKLMVHERRREIAVIKSFGAGNGMVLRILLFDVFFVSITAIILAAILLLIARKMAAVWLPQLGSMNIRNIFAATLVIGMLLTLMVLFATGFVMRNVVKQKPAELLRQ